MTRHTTQNDLDLSWMFLRRAGHHCVKWEESSHLWEYTIKCEDCGQRFGISIHFDNEYEDNGYSKKRNRMRRLWLYLAPEDPKVKNTQLIEFATPMDIQMLTCSEAAIQDVIK